jgi:tetratricopeptide (TPR) repeat protein
VNQVSQGALGLTLLLLGDREQGSAAADRTIELNPNNALWLGLLGSWVSARGDFDRGVPWTRRALELNPNPPPWIHMPMFLDHYHNGRYEAALVEAQNTDTDDYRTFLFLAAAYGQLGRLEEAERPLAQMIAALPVTAGEMRRDLNQRNGYEPELVEHLMEGLRKAGFDDERPGQGAG